MKWKDHVRLFGHAGTRLDVTVRVTRLLLLSFVVTFLSARIVVFLIAEQLVPNMFLIVGGTHVHHLNYGIYILSLVGLLLLLVRPKAHGLYFATIAYGVGLALTYDEFGMWLFLGGSYNNHMTFDAVAIIAAILALLALATTVEEFHPRHWVLAAAVAGLVLLLVALVVVAHCQGILAKAFTIEGL